MTTTASVDAPKRVQQIPFAPVSERCAESTALLDLLKKKRWSDARARAAALAIERPADPLPQKALAAAAFHTGRFRDAVDHFCAALDLRPTEAESRINLAKALIQFGAHDEAVQALHRAAASNGEKLGAEDLFQEALALAAACDPNGARERLREAASLSPGETKLYELYARIAFLFPEAETTSDGARLLMRMLVDPRIENRGAQRCASLTLMEELELGRRAAEKGDERRPESWFTPLMIALLGNALNTDHRLEPVLIGLRADLLRRVASAPNEPLSRENLDLAEAFARHGFRSEYIWPETEGETARVTQLQAYVETTLSSGASLSAAALYLLGAYRELARIEPVAVWAKAVATQSSGALGQTLRMMVLDPLQEAELAPTLPSLTPIEEGVSAAVQAQYEANPYPRWSALSQEEPRPYIEHIAARPYPKISDLKPTATAPKVLIAGCGTGQHPIGSARRFKDSYVLGVDLSRASLAYAARQAHQLGVTNLAFAQADILRLEGVDDTFDVVESSGVLHHMQDPEAGLRRLVAALKPGGHMNIGLYSRIARRHITAARELIAERGYADDRAGIRQFRTDVVNGALPSLTALAYSLDFYSTSNLRDLVFHVQEHQFDLPQLKAMLERNGLEFLRFANISPTMMRGYREAYPQDPTLTDLLCWAEFEENHPHTFAGMYQFWCRKL